jgi:hypothetical protein
VARIHGRNGALYVALTSGGSAEPLAFTKSWSIDFATDRQDVTAFQDGTKVYVAGLPDASGSFSGFYDDATGQTFQSAVDGLARKFYLYPTTSTATTYFWGTAFFDFSVTTDVAGAAEVSGTFSAASSITKQG